jgi:hypothetical protein
MLIGQLLGFLLLPVGLLCSMLFSRLATPLEHGENRHGEDFFCV